MRNYSEKTISHAFEIHTESLLDQLVSDPMSVSTNSILMLHLDGMDQFFNDKIPEEELDEIEASLYNVPKFFADYILFTMSRMDYDYINTYSALNDISEQFWVKAEQAIKSFIICSPPNEDKLELEFKLLYELIGILLDAGGEIKRTNHEQRNFQNEIKNSSSNLRRALKNEDAIYKNKAFSFKRILQSSEALLKDLEYFSSESNRESEPAKEFFLFLKQLHNYVPSSYSYIENIENTYSHMTKSDQYKGNKRPPTQRLFATQLTKWFVRCTDKPHKKICLDAVAATLTARYPQINLVKDPLN